MEKNDPQSEEANRIREFFEKIWDKNIEELEEAISYLKQTPDFKAYMALSAVQQGGSPLRMSEDETANELLEEIRNLPEVQRVFKMIRILDHAKSKRRSL
ncbi:MAG: hypothetical protein AAB840_01045 [Patescibacteria group bacterium]